jgi:RecA/RadA recombinase
MQSKEKDLQDIAEGLKYEFNAHFSTLRQLAAKANDYPDKQQLFGNYILEGDIVLFASPAGVGKTFLALNIAVAITNKLEEFLGEPITIHGNVLYVNYELSTRTLSKRAKKILSSFPDSVNAFECIVFNSRGSLKKDLARITEKAMQKKVVLIIIDNLNMSDVTTDAMSSRDIAKLLYTLLAIQDVTHSAILLIDHVRKKDWGTSLSSQSTFGSSLKTNHVDADMFLMKSAKDKNLRLLKRGKSRNAEEDDTVKLIRFENNLSFSLVDSSIVEAEHIALKNTGDKDITEDHVLSLNGEGKSIRQIAAILSLSKSTVQRILKKAGIEINSVPTTVPNGTNGTVCHPNSFNNNPLK